MNAGPLVRAIVVALVMFSAPLTGARAQTASPQTSGPTPHVVDTPPRGLLTEPRALAKAFSFVDRKLDGDEGEVVKGGFFPELGNMVTGAGWISAGFGYRRPLFDQRAMVEASTAISWRAYKMTQARFELTDLAGSNVSVGTQVRWQDLAQVTYYGTGAESLEIHRSEYRLKSLNQVGYVIVRPQQWLAVEGRVGWLSGPELRRPGGAFLRGNPATDQVFTGEPAAAAERATELPVRRNVGHR